jgi:radical SAM superfamily enzyme YgiQ (UPF0313 family)
MKALLIYPEFSSFGFYNFKEACRLLGAKYMAPPLGLITMAALLPSDWELRLLDLNTTALHDTDIDWADLVFIGGMLNQQSRFLRLITLVHARGKKVVAGGPDPTLQPDLYSTADYLVLGEAESTIKPFLEDLARGAHSGTYLADHRPDITTSPVPRFDLLRLNNYLMSTIQCSRGCPYNCEFCDIIELFGRQPRTKTPQQIVNELDMLYRLGHRGHVDIVDDNFIGSKSKAREILCTMREWSEEHRHPFFFSTECSINLVDDEELLELMRDVGFRYVTIGLESVDDHVLSSMQKNQNINRDFVADIHKIYSYGIVVVGMFVLGFDNETNLTAKRIIDVIERGKIVISPVGLLYAVPHTQLARRLYEEGRLFEDSSRQIGDPESVYVDQMTSGINFVTKRPREEVIKDFLWVLEETYSTRRYFNRCLNASLAIRVKDRYKWSFSRKLQYLSAYMKTVIKLGLPISTAYYYWRNIFIVAFTRASSLEILINLMAVYLHLGPHSKFVSRLMREKLRDLRSHPPGVAERIQQGEKGILLQPPR